MQAYVFIENNAIVPIENSMYIIYHDLTKRSFNTIRRQSNFNRLVYMNVNWPRDIIISIYQGNLCS